MAQKNGKLPAHEAIFRTPSHIPEEFSHMVSKEELIIAYCLLLPSMIIPENKIQEVRDGLTNLKSQFHFNKHVVHAIQYALRNI